MQNEGPIFYMQLISCLYVLLRLRYLGFDRQRAPLLGIHQAFFLKGALGKNGLRDHRQHRDNGISGVFLKEMDVALRMWEGRLFQRVRADTQKTLGLQSSCFLCHVGQ